MSKFDFHTLLIVYSAVLTTRTLAAELKNGAVTFDTYRKRRLLQLKIADKRRCGCDV